VLLSNAMKDRFHSVKESTKYVQTLKDVAISSTIFDAGESESDSETSVEHINHHNDIAASADANILVTAANIKDSNCTSHFVVANSSEGDCEIDKSLNEALSDAVRLHQLHPVGPNYSFGKRFVKLGVHILLFYEQKWHLAKVGLSRKSDQELHRLNFVHDQFVWLDVELKISDHGIDKQKWILMTDS